MAVDPLLGTDADWKAFVDAAPGEAVGRLEAVPGRQAARREWDEDDQCTWGASVCDPWHARYFDAQDGNVWDGYFDACSECTGADEACSSGAGSQNCGDVLGFCADYGENGRDLLDDADWAAIAAESASVGVESPCVSASCEANPSGDVCMSELFAWCVADTSCSAKGCSTQGHTRVR